MPRKVSIGVCSLAVLALSATIAPAAQAANTWEGVWNSDFGRLTMSAGGSGSYEGFSPGTISGPAVGDVNEGRWSQPGNQPETRSGTYRFVLSAGGQSFTGTWAYENGSCGTACGWNGTCIEGACLKNGVDDGGGGGEEEGGSCKARSGGSGSLAKADDGLCPRDVKFSFGIRRGLPEKPDAKDLPNDLAEISVHGGGQVIRSTDIGKGLVHLSTTHQAGVQTTFNEIDLLIAGLAEYEENRRTKHIKITFEGLVGQSSDPSCEVGEPFVGTFGLTEKDAALRLDFSAVGDVGCLSAEPILWRTKSFKKASIKKVKP